ncbi:MAG: TetR/AcrR family transcriptional regulator [Deltaproteobacteria bacterium]|nr:TetR/AcrR family transcriptional regulator [Deltaproteobacteria bacterium]
MTKPITKLKSIEDTAIRLFAFKGIKQVTIKDIAKKAECSEGALYRHYTGKDEMARKLYSREVEKFGATLKAVLKGKGTFSARLKSAVELFYSFFDEDPLTFTFILLSEYNFPVEQKVAFDANPYKLVFEFIEEGVKNGEFGIRDPKLGAAMVLGLVLQPATLRASGRLGRTRMSEKTHEVVEACLRVLKGEKKLGVRTQKSESRRKKTSDF